MHAAKCACPDRSVGCHELATYFSLPCGPRSRDSVCPRDRDWTTGAMMVGMPGAWEG